MVKTNDLLLGGMVIAGGYLLYTNGIFDKVWNMINGIAAPGGSNLNLTGSSSTPPASTSTCADGSTPGATGLCANGAPPIGPANPVGPGLQPGPSPVGTGVNNVPPSNTFGSTSVSPVVSGGVDIGGPGVNAPIFTDPVTGQSYDPTTGQFLTPGAPGASLPNFAPFVEPQGSQFPNLPGQGTATIPIPNQCGAGTRFSQCFGNCVPTGLAEPAPNSPQCIGLQSQNIPIRCADGSTPNAQGLCANGQAPIPTTTAPPGTITTFSPNLPATNTGGTCVQTQACMQGYVWDSTSCSCVPSGQTVSPAPGTTTTTSTPPPSCPAGSFWNPVAQQCNFPGPIPTTPPPTPTPTPVTTPTPTPTPVTPTPTPTSTPTPTPAPAQSSTGTLNCSKSGSGCCNSSHKGNCHSECGFGKNMTSSTCKACLAVCGTYNGSCNCSTGTAAAGFAYAGRVAEKVSYQTEGAMIRGTSEGYNRYHKPHAKIVSRAYASPRGPTTITQELYSRPRYTGSFTGIAVS